MAIILATTGLELETIGRVDLLVHYKISLFYRRKYSVGVWFAVRRWFIYWRLHRRITSVGFPFVGDSPFRRYIGRKHKKTICRWFYRRNLLAKNIPTDFADGLKYTDGFSSVGDIVSYRRIHTVSKVGKVVDECLKYRLNISVCKFIGNCVKCRRIQSVGKSVGECLKYRPNISVYKYVGEYYCQIPTD